MLVNELMSKNVVTIESTNTVLEACRRYHRHKIGCLVVMRFGMMVGIITERDIITRVIIPLRDPFKTKVEEIMSTNIKTIHPSEDVKLAAEIMGKYKIKKLPVVSDKKELVGIITITDIANTMPNFLKSLAEGHDAELNREDENKVPEATV